MNIHRSNSRKMFLYPWWAYGIDWRSINSASYGVQALIYGEASKRAFHAVGGKFIHKLFYKLSSSI